MTIYVDDGSTVKIYPVTPKVAKAVMTLLEADDGLVWSETHTGYGVAIVDRVEVKASIDAELKGLIDAEYSNCQ